MTTAASSGPDHSFPPSSSRSYSTRISRPPPSSSVSAAAASNTGPSSASASTSSTQSSQHQAQRHHHRRASSSSRPAHELAPQNDHDSSRLASSSRRSLSRDRDRTADRDRDRDRDRPPPPPKGPDASSTPSRPPHRRTSTRSNHRQHQSRPPPDTMSPSSAAAASSAATSANSSASPHSHHHHPSASQHQHHHHAAAPDASPMPPAKPTRSRTSIPTPSGKWILGKTIGAGSMGKVKLARKEDGSDQVACKIVPRGSTDDGHHSRADKERADQSKEIRTAREAAIVTLLSHPHICGMRDVVRTNYHWYMLFEYVNGGQMLDYIISHGKLKEKQARKFSRQIASALDYCHRNSIVHRDLKIENILISKTGDIKIIDFGLSNLFSPRSHLKTFCGSLYFAAPELLQARAYTGPEVDVWSFGIVLYVLVCGKVPFDDQSMPALHAKIKKGLVDYPTWLSTECKHLMSRMLVTDPKQRATMQEVMAHSWMTKGFNGPPENYLPAREPLSQPLDPDVIHAMQGFNFGPPDSIRNQLMKIIESDEYQQAVKVYQRDREVPQPSREAERRRGFGFDFYKRRNSGNSRDTLTGPSFEALPLGSDPLNAFNPLLSIYYLVREKQEREQGHHGTHSATFVAREKERIRERKETAAAVVPELTPPKAAHTNAAAFEMPGEKPTGGRSRPRARTHGEDDEPASQAQAHQASQTPQQSEAKAEQSQKKEGAAAGLLRRFSTRKRREPERMERDRTYPPVVQVHSPAEASPATPKKSFSIRRGRRERDGSVGPALRSGESQPQHGDLLSPPVSARGGGGFGRKTGLGRSTSVNSADVRRPREMLRLVKEPPATSGSDQSESNEHGGLSRRSHGQLASASMRTKSLGHARRESIQRRRLKREAMQGGNLPEETDLEQDQDQSGVSTERLASSDLAKPVYLKGLFSVSTTSGKSVPAIRADIKRVLRLLKVDYREIKGGFSCRHSPSIDLSRVQEAGPGQTPSQRRRFSFGGLKRGDEREREGEREGERERERERDRTPTASRTTPGRSDRDRSYSNSETSVDSIPRRSGVATKRAPGETSTQVQSDLGGSMVMEFEILMVKVPLLSLHGIQFKRLSGNTWQYKNMADQILRELRL